MYSLGLIHDGAQPQRTRQDHIRRVERSKELDGLARKLQPQTEHVVVVAREKLLEIRRLVRPGVIAAARKAVQEAFLVLLLVRLEEPRDGLDCAHARLLGGEEIQNLGPRESLVAQLQIRVGFPRQARVVLQHAIPGFEDVVGRMHGQDVPHNARLGDSAGPVENILVVKDVRCHMLELLGNTTDMLLGRGDQPLLELYHS